MAQASIRYDGLRAPISEAQIDAVLRADGTTMTRRRWHTIVTAASLFIGWWVGPLGTTTSLMRLMAMCLVALVASAALLGLGRVFMGMYRTVIANQLRMQQFARDNSLRYTKRINNPAYQGVIFSTGSERRITDQFIGNVNGEFEVANYQYTVQHGKSSTTYHNGFIRIALERHVAHMLLDSKANNTSVFGMHFSNLPITMARDQTVQLEGDFDNHFTLYAPKEYERDALYIFTPDLMALLIDEANQCDMEVIDDQLYVYGKEFTFQDEATWRRIMMIISTIGAKTISQTDYYADERVGDSAVDVVAAGGRRLRRGIPWPMVAVMLFGLLIASGELFLRWVTQR